ncbi:MAG: F0F1 ATP synthase subunit epsilon [Candidatus Omnitrophota bacterium]
MAKSFHVGIYSKDKIVYEGKAIYLVAPSVEGSLGILADHAAMVVKLLNGKITLRTPDGNISLIDSSGNGFLEVLHNQVTLLL